MASHVDAFLSGLNKTAAIEKTAEEVYMDKLASVNQTVECSTALRLAGEQLAELSTSQGLNKQASALFVDCAEGLFVAADAFMSGLQKCAADNQAGMITDMVYVSDGLTKIANTLSEIAVDAEDESFTKLASSVLKINNILADELNELAANDESVANFIQSALAAE